MKAAKIISYVAAAIIAVYAIVVLCINVSVYAEYVSYYGFAQVFVTIAGAFFTVIPWAALFLVAGVVCGYFEKKDQLDGRTVVFDDGMVDELIEGAFDDEPDEFLALAEDEGAKIASEPEEQLSAIDERAEGTAEEAGEATEKAVGQAEEAVEKTVEDTGEAVETAEERVKDAE